ncbi:MAG TPA: hypothetical protein VHB46_00015 [Burkholderiales bacterium]|nr:hypothetical protein [Burkholderiales bacterium]
MCFEFEALYWAKLAEEEEKRKETEKLQQAAEAGRQHVPARDEEPLPA